LDYLRGTLELRLHDHVERLKGLSALDPVAVDEGVRRPASVEVGREISAGREHLGEAVLLDRGLYVAPRQLNLLGDRLEARVRQIGLAVEERSMCPPESRVPPSLEGQTRQAGRRPRAVMEG
jgi:hypothetical protein